MLHSMPGDGLHTGTPLTGTPLTGTGANSPAVVRASGLDLHLQNRRGSTVVVVQDLPDGNFREVRRAGEKKVAKGETGKALWVAAR